jgi:hypothetical protein
MKRSWHLVWVFLAVVRVAGAAENCSAEGKRSDGKPYHIALSSAWTDKEILHTLGLDIRAAKLTISQGPDGVARSYRSKKNRLHIVRSHSTGTYVMLSVNGDDAYEWYLPDCRFETSVVQGSEVPRDPDQVQSHHRDTSD